MGREREGEGRVEKEEGRREKMDEHNNTRGRKHSTLGCSNLHSLHACMLYAMCTHNTILVVFPLPSK